MRLLPTLALFFPVVVQTAELPTIPAQPIGVKKEQLFTDDFNRMDMGTWKQVVPTFTVEDNALKGTQTRDKDLPAADGKQAVKAHQAVAGNDVPTKDSIITCRFKFAGASSLSVEFDDRKYEGSHYGHICKIAITPTNVTLIDQKDGSMRNDIYEMKDPSQKAERAKLLVGRSATFPNQIDATTWHDLILETIDDAMRVTIDGKAVGYLKSSGIAHPTKSKIELGCGGKDGYFDDLTVWNAEPVK